MRRNSWNTAELPANKYYSKKKKVTQFGAPGNSNKHMAKKSFFYYLVSTYPIYNLKSLVLACNFIRVGGLWIDKLMTVFELQVGQPQTNHVS